MNRSNLLLSLEVQDADTQNLSPQRQIFNLYDNGLLAIRTFTRDDDYGDKPKAEVYRFAMKEKFEEAKAFIEKNLPLFSGCPNDVTYSRPHEEPEFFLLIGNFCAHGTYHLIAQNEEDELILDLVQEMKWSNKISGFLNYLLQGHFYSNDFLLFKGWMAEMDAIKPSDLCSMTRLFEQNPDEYPHVSSVSQAIKGAARNVFDDFTRPDGKTFNELISILNQEMLPILTSAKNQKEFFDAHNAMIDELERLSNGEVPFHRLAYWVDSAYFLMLLSGKLITEESKVKYLCTPLSESALIAISLSSDKEDYLLAENKIFEYCLYSKVIPIYQHLRDLIIDFGERPEESGSTA